MSVLKNIIFLTVGVIVLLHTVVHHDHAKSTGSLEIKAQNNCSTFGDNVLLLFTIDHGNGHLEHFLNMESVTPALHLSGVLQTTYLEIDSSLSYFDYSEAFTVLYIPTDALRGPPIS